MDFNCVAMREKAKHFLKSVKKVEHELKRNVGKRPKNNEKITAGRDSEEIDDYALLCGGGGN